MAPLSAAVLLLASLAHGDDGAARRLEGAAALSQAGANAGDPAAARDTAGAALDGNPPSTDAVDGRGSIKRGLPLQKPSLAASTRAGSDVPLPMSKDDPNKLSHGLILGGAAVLGGLQGWFSAGLVGAAAGAGLGLAAAWLFSKKDYGGAFGVTAGAIIGTAFGGPLGGLVGAAIGGIVGHFLGKLFL